LQIAEVCEQVRYIKVESGPAPYKVAQAVEQAGERLAVFGGMGGNYFIEEMRRGSVGTMPGCCQPEAFVAVWDAFQNGDEPAAREAFYRWILPINRLMGQAPGAFYGVSKTVLQRRGIICTTKIRGPMTPLDEMTQRELQAVVDELYGGG
ncbi:MAG: dihydrodipicolinate synthase family protein, partial [Anaerolineae bacterium]|nr:dihydrodipicolinate synthase family protein [Anaerolineae bacterium]